MHPKQTLPVLFSALGGSARGRPLVAKASTWSSRALLRLSELLDSHQHALDHVKRVQGRVQSLQRHTEQGQTPAVEQGQTPAVGRLCKPGD